MSACDWLLVVSFGGFLQWLTQMEKLNEIQEKK